MMQINLRYGTTCTAAVFLLLGLPVTANAAAPVARPNFIVIMADDLGAKELGCYGHPSHRTPHLDRLAAQGMRFRTCYSTPLCSPTRVMIMTGRYAFHTGWYNFINRPGSPTYKDKSYDLGKAEITFADVLKQRGYATALAGKWQLTGQLPTLVRDCGFDEYLVWAWKHKLPPGAVHDGAWEGDRNRRPARYWHPGLFRNGELISTRPEDYGPSLFADFVIDFARRHQGQPFVVYFPMCLTHTPWDPTPDLNRPGKKTRGGLKNNVEYMDHLVGRITDALDEMKLSERTIVLFTGDNGTQHAGKAETTELGARVPLIVRYPGQVPAGVVSDELVDLTDVLPTLADFAGANLPSDRPIDGISLAPTLRGRPGTHREWIFSYLHEERVLRTGRWLLEGDGRFFDCGDRRDGSGYRDVTRSTDPEVLEARKQFEKILSKLPAPRGLDPCPSIENRKRQRAQARTGTRG
jgi:arylsulfatase A